MTLHKCVHLYYVINRRSHANQPVHIVLYYVDTTIFNGLEALLLTHSNLQLRSCHQVTLHYVYDRWRTITSPLLA